MAPDEKSFMWAEPCARGLYAAPFSAAYQLIASGFKDIAFVALLQKTPTAAVPESFIV